MDILARIFVNVECPHARACVWNVSWYL